jgi:hypothetical protein
MVAILQAAVNQDLLSEIQDFWYLLSGIFSVPMKQWKFTELK